ncbi:MAG: tRNA (adenosine(37)-N6)-threonylcarbamoyltransferase complex ATPase subunit type 1 TsaE [Sodalis sp. (in: enterobacteria)]
MENRLIFLSNEITTSALGAALATACHQACIIYLYGELGAGKTTFCRGFLRALGHAENVKSPTYTLVESYALPCWTVYHLDLYRLRDPEELEFIGVREYFDGKAICLVEWPHRGKGILPVGDISLMLHYQGDGRQAQAKAASTLGKNILTQLKFQQGIYL